MAVEPLAPKTDPLTELERLLADYEKSKHAGWEQRSAPLNKVIGPLLEHGAELCAVARTAQQVIRENPAAGDALRPLYVALEPFKVREEPNE